jgi:hypothetical protein
LRPSLTKRFSRCMGVSVPTYSRWSRYAELCDRRMFRTQVCSRLYTRHPSLNFILTRVPRVAL